MPSPILNNSGRLAAVAPGTGVVARPQSGPASDLPGARPQGKPGKPAASVVKPAPPVQPAPAPKAAAASPRSSGSSSGSRSGGSGGGIDAAVIRGVVEDVFESATGRQLGDFIPGGILDRLPGGQKQETAAVVPAPQSGGIGIWLIIGAGLFLLWKGAK